MNSVIQIADLYVLFYNAGYLVLEFQFKAIIDFYQTDIECDLNGHKINYQLIVLRSMSTLEEAHKIDSN